MSDPSGRVLILIIAFGIEAMLAYPAAVFRAIGHPVSWIGALIAALDSALNRPDTSFAARRAAGVATVLLLLAGSLAVRALLAMVARDLPYLGFAVAVLVVATLIAVGNLDQHVRAVSAALRAEGLAGGLPGIIAYKAINTADSMIGHMSERHRAFGWAAARLDDVVNLPASRLTGLMFVVAATMVPGASAPSAWRAYWR